MTKKNLKLVHSLENTCGYCGKSYKRKSYYESHILICEEIHKSKYCKMADQEQEEDELTMKEMQVVLRHFIMKCENLNNEVQRLRSYVERTKKRISVLDWLNDECNLENDYYCWIQRIEINENELEEIFRLNYVNGLLWLLQKYLPMDDIINHPIKCFQEKQGIFYMYSKKKWIIMDDRVFNKFINTLNQKLMKIFFTWKEKHRDKIENDDHFHEIYIENMRIILGGTKPKEQTMRLIKNKLYTYLKCNLKNIIQYEFTF